MLSIELSKDIELRLKEAASAAGRSVESLALDAILSHLEDVEDIATAERELARVRAGEPTIPLDRVLAKHGLAR